jgi:hypothetical protein
VVEQQEAVSTVNRVENVVTGLMTQDGHLSVISETSRAPVAVMTIAHHDRHPRAVFAPEKEDIDPEIGHPRDMTDMIDGGRDLLMEETVDIEAQALEAEQDTKANPTYPSRDVPQGMCRTCRSLLLTILTGKYYRL